MRVGLQVALMLLFVTGAGHGHAFVFFHECAHIQRQTFDEIEANCQALTEVRRRGLIDAAGEVALGA